MKEGAARMSRRGGPRPPPLPRPPRPPAPRRPRRRPEASPSLFDAISAPPEDAELLEDLLALVALGLLEERPSPEGPVYALTELGRLTDPGGAHRLGGMCRNIRPLHNFEPPATESEVHEAAL